MQEANCLLPNFAAFQGFIWKVLEFKDSSAKLIHSIWLNGVCCNARRRQGCLKYVNNKTGLIVLVPNATYSH